MKKQEYYILKPACGTTETGNVYPQCSQMSANYEHNAPNSYKQLVHYQLPDFEPNLKAFKLHAIAKPTDYISATFLYFGMLVSKKFRMVLEKFSLPQHDFFSASLEIKQQITNSYYFFHPVGNIANKIDFTKTQFYLWDNFELHQPIAVKDENELSKYKKEHKIKSTWVLYTDKYHFTDNYITEMDLFQTTYTDPRTYISHRLKTALEEAHITGIEIVPTDVI